MQNLIHQTTQLDIPGVQLERTGLKITTELEMKDWHKCGKFLSHLNGATMWWLGDWCNYADQNYGKKYTQLIQATEYEISTLMNASWVCRKIPTSLRSEILSFEHHKVIASLEPTEQKKWIQIAEKESLSVAELRERIRQSVAPESMDDDGHGGFHDISSIGFDFDQIYRATFREKEIEDCFDANRLRKWAEATERIADVNRRAKAQLERVKG